MAVNRQGGLSDAPAGDNFIGAFMIGDYDDPSVAYFSGREVDTGPGETGRGVTSNQDVWEDTGYPTDTSFTSATSTDIQQSLRATFSQTAGGDARVGAYRVKLSYKGRSEETVISNQRRNGKGNRHSKSILHIIRV